MLLHASCIVINGRAVLLAGPPGAGKSDLALRLIDDGAQLVADDQTFLSVAQDVLLATPPESIAGLIEIRQVGLTRMAFVASAPVALYVDLTAMDAVLERLPESEYITLLEQKVRRLRLPAFAASTPAKIRATLTHRLIA